VRLAYEDLDRLGRAPTAEEHAEFEELLEEAQAHGVKARQLPESGAYERLLQGDGQTLTANTSGSNRTVGGSDPGARFVQSEQFKSIMDPARRGDRWSTGPIEITDGPPMQFKGTLGEGGFTAGGWAFVSTPQVAPGLVDVLFQELTVERNLSAGQATGATVRSIVEGTATSAAAGVLEGGLKPESTIGFGIVDEPVRKTATTLSLSDEMLEDQAALQSFINTSLTTFVQQEVERQLLRGTASGAEVQGLLTGRSVPIYSAGTAAGTKADQIFKAQNSMRGSALIEPDWTILSVQDYESLRMLKDSANQYLGGGPFEGQYGTGGMASSSNQIISTQQSLWGKPVFVTTALNAGTALCGTRSNAQVFSRGGISVEVGHDSDDFTHDLVTVRCHRRVALCVYRPKGFCEVRLS
jgi:HK97 family phage major capsid protein